MKSFYDFNTNSPSERQERYRQYPELSRFHIALREEMSEEEYQLFYQSEKEAVRRTNLIIPQRALKWKTA